MSYSVKALLRAAASAAVVLVLSLVLVSGVVGCGGDSTTTTTQRTVTTGVGATTTTDGPVDAGVLVGKWYSEKLEETLEFTSDGKMTWTRDSQTGRSWPFTVEAGAIVFTQPNAPVPNNIPFVVSGGTLTTQDPKYGELFYTRK